MHTIKLFYSISRAQNHKDVTPCSLKRSYVPLLFWALDMWVFAHRTDSPFWGEPRPENYTNRCFLRLFLMKTRFSLQTADCAMGEYTCLLTFCYAPYIHYPSHRLGSHLVCLQIHPFAQHVLEGSFPLHLLEFNITNIIILIFTAITNCLAAYVD